MLLLFPALPPKTELLDDVEAPKTLLLSLAANGLEDVLPKTEEDAADVDPTFKLPNPNAPTDVFGKDC